MKEKLGAINVLYPTPTTLVGATVNGKPNFITIAHIGINGHNPMVKRTAKKPAANANRQTFELPYER